MSASKLQFKRLEELAISLIDTNKYKRCYHFSFIIYKKKIVSVGTNASKTHPANLKNRKISKRTGEDISEQKHTCSELNAICKFKKLTNIHTEKCTLINLRYDRNWNIAIAKPCMSCENLLKNFILQLKSTPVFHLEILKWKNTFLEVQHHFTECIPKISRLARLLSWLAVKFIYNSWNLVFLPPD